jgi:GNAT superfamily N-acetyltransferase
MSTPVKLADLQIIRYVADKHDVSAFDCGDSDLNDFLKSDAGKYENEHLSHTRLAFLDGELAAYLTILSDCIVLKTPEKKKALGLLRGSHQLIYSFPAIKIGRLGVHSSLQRSGVGRELLKYTVGLAVRLNKELGIGCRFITVDAYPDSVTWYQKNGFVLNKHYPKPAHAHQSMRYDILKSPQIT